MELPARLISRDFIGVQHLQHGQQRRSFLLVGGAGAAQEDVCATTLFTPSWPTNPSLPVHSCSRGGRTNGQTRCSPPSSVWKRSSLSGNSSVDSGEAQIAEQLWEEYFADPSQWWDNRVEKRNPRSPDFKHMVTRRALWIDGWDTPAWVKSRLDTVTQGKLQSHVGYRGRDLKDTQQPNRLPKDNHEKRNTLPISARELRRIVHGGDGRRHGKIPSATNEAIAALQARLEQGNRINSNTYVEVLKRCLKHTDFVAAKQVHDCIIKSGIEQNIYVANNLLSVYIGCGRLQDARRVFDGLSNKNVFSWTIMIGGYSQHNRAKDAMEVFNQMCQEGVQPNEVTYLSILKAFVSPAALKQADLVAAKRVHDCIIKSRMEQNMYVASNLLRVNIRCGRLQDARRVFDALVLKDVIIWTIMIEGYAQHNRAKDAMEVFNRMRQESVQPNQVTYLSILKAFVSPATLEWGKEVHAYIRHDGLESDLRVGSALVHMYTKCGSIDDAQLVFDRMKDHNVMTWSAMIGAYAESGRGIEAYQLYLQMKREGFVPNAITYMSILNACASAGALEWVKNVHSHILAAGLESDLRVGSALVHMYAKSGSIDEARLVFDRMEDRDVMTWTMLIGGLAQHGRGHEALELFRKMNADGVKPDECSFVSVLSACSHAGLVDEGRRFFSIMSQDYGIKPTVLHCNCMVDLLGRGGHLEEAKLFIDNMPVEPDGATWGALLGACRTYGNVELGELTAIEILKLEPKNPSPYVLLSNIYAAAGKWEEVSLMRTTMQKRGIRKEPGRSWIEVDNKIHDFVVGDKSHPEATEIYAELNRLSERIKAEGYIPDTRLVLKNIDEEDKELALCSHSEKLAIAYGLMRTARGKPIRVYKNLRVCSDCHAATKLISKVTGREIVARDANRFHHFKDGVCSCGDYW